MRIIIGFIAVLSLISVGCSKSNSGPTSPEGKWTYTTPDNKINVTFDLVKTSTGSYDVQNQTIKIEGVSYNAEKQVTGVVIPAIASIRINANDAKAVYPYYVQFLNGTVSSDFRRIDVATGEYTFPWGTTVSLKTVSIVRP